MKHSKNQHEWIEWKAAQLSSITGKNPFHIQQEPIKIKNPTTGELTTTGTLYTKVHYQSRALQCLTALHEELYTNNVLDFSKPWLMNYVTEESLMIWWLDDGGLMGIGRRRGKLATHGFPVESLPYLQQLLFNKWGIYTTIQRNTYNDKTYFYLQLSPRMLKLFLRIIMRYIPIESMIYKTYLEYKNPILQKHWIFTMYEEIRPSFHPYLKKHIGPKPDRYALAKEIIGRSPWDSLEEEFPIETAKLQKVDLLYEEPDSSYEADSSDETRPSFSEFIMPRLLRYGDAPFF